MQKNILIIGCNSAIGKEVIQLSTQQGDNIIATSRSPIDISVNQFIQLDPNGDLSDLDFYQNQLMDCYIALVQFH